MSHPYRYLACSVYSTPVVPPAGAWSGTLVAALLLALTVFALAGGLGGC